MNKNKYLLIFILFIGFLLRLLPFNFPLFSADDVRIATRGYTLAKYGTDELGRKYPYIFNSSEDYQLPATAYITAIGSFIFGKTGLGVRSPFILIGTLLIFFVYQLAKLILYRKKMAIYAAIITCFSPGLIFFSKFPNEFIIAALLLVILLNLLLSEKVNKAFFLLIISLMLLTSKIFWFTLIPIIIFTLYTNKKLTENRLFILISALVLNFSVIVIFIKIPQGIRSLSENNFSGFFDITVKNGIERLRSQSISYWPPFLDKILFSKAHILIAAFSNWISNFQLSILFAQINKSGMFGFLNQGALPKIMIIPFLTGIYTVFNNKQSKTLNLLIYIALLTFPLFFLYPNLKVGYIILILPLICIIISNGLINLNIKVLYLVVSLAIFEVIVSYVFISSSIKNAVNVRPVWIKQAVNDIYSYSLTNKIYVSDNSVSNLISFIEWYTPIETRPSYKNVIFPYKFYEGEILNIKTIGESNEFVGCKPEKSLNIFATKRDIDKLSKIDKQIRPTSIYKNDSGEEILYFVKTDTCIR